MEPQNYKGKLISNPCDHQFSHLGVEDKRMAIKINGFRDQNVGLWRCDRCKDYCWSM